MEIKIIKETENPLFNRKEIQAEISSEKTPRKIEVQKLISEKFSAPAENIKIKNILGKFGSKNFRILANIYASKEDKENTEQKTKKEIEAEKPAEISESLSEEKPAETTEVKSEESSQEENIEEEVKEEVKEETTENKEEAKE